DGGNRLAHIVNAAAERHGKLIIPAFAIGRVEEGLYWLWRLETNKQIPVLPVFVDSPMAAAGLQFYASRAKELDAAAPSAGRHSFAFATARLTVVGSPPQSAELVAARQPA